jgi:hypothetical protein
MGKMTHRSLTLLMALANVRLGIWLPNPERAKHSEERPIPRTSGGWLWQRAIELGRGPGPMYLLLEALGLMHLGRNFVYITDGGHYENLGLVELLRRGCTRIYCFDASGDHLDTFNTIGQAIALAQSELNVEIDIDLTPMAPELPNSDEGSDATNPAPVFSGNDHAIGTITYGNGVQGDLIFVKTAIIQEAPADVLAYRDRDPLFPSNPTTDQLYGDEKFEAYRRLGAFSADRALHQFDVVLAERGGNPLPQAKPPSGRPSAF